MRPYYTDKTKHAENYKGKDKLFKIHCMLNQNPINAKDIIVNKKWLVISMGVFEEQCHAIEIIKGDIEQGEIYFGEHKTFKEKEVIEIDFYGRK